MNVVNQPIVKHKLGLFNLAEELGNVSQACKIMGVSRDTFYRYREAKDTGGVAAVSQESASPQTNDICERFHKTILQEFYQMTFHKKLYQTMAELQQDLDLWIAHYNHERTHQGKMCCGRTPMETFRDGKQIWQDQVDQLNLT